MTEVRDDRAPRRMRDDVGAVAVGVVGAAVVRDGAFATGDAVVFPLALVILAVVGRCRIEARWRPMVAAVAALSLWWLVAALGWGDLADATPLLGSFVGFAAAAVIVANLAPDQHAQLRSSLVVGAAAFAAAGLVGLAVRTDGLASRAQGLWRLSGTLTYANAAGLLLAMILPLAIAERGRADAPRWTGSAVAVIVTGLAASMSRGAAVALLVALPVVWRSLRGAWWPLAIGASSGILAIATASSGSNQPVVIVVALAAALLASFPAPPWGSVAAGTIVVGALLGLAPSIRTGVGDVIERRVAWSEIDDRTPEWRGALNEFIDQPVIGIGPERPFVSRPSGRTELARYAHSEPLQIAMSAGVIGLALLVGVAGTVYRLLRSGSGPPAAVAGVIVFTIGGVLDFSWHLPAIGIVGGILSATAGHLGRKNGREEG